MMLSAIQFIMKRILPFTVYILLCSAISTNSYASSISPNLDKRIARITKHLADNKHEKALARLEPLLKYADANTYQGALIHQIAGYAYLGLGKHDVAIDHFRTCVDKNKLPDQLTQNIQYILAQLYLSTSQHEKAEEQYRKWASSANPMKASEYALGGYIFISRKKYSDAEKYLIKATKHDSENTESWLNLLLYVYYETKQYNKARDILSRLILQKPAKADYWRRLSDIYYELGDISGSLAVMQIADQNNLLSQESDYLKLAALLSEQNLPYNTGSLIENSLKNEKLPNTPPLISTLFNAYSSARERYQAIELLTKYSSAEQHPLLFIDAAYQYMTDEEWEKAEKLLLQVYESDPALPDTHLAMGIINIKQKAYKEAKTWLDKAMLSKQTNKAAIEWSNYLNGLSSKRKPFVANMIAPAP
jgi:tetratricopeptide (TPR) repeat protein